MKLKRPRHPNQAASQKEAVREPSRLDRRDVHARTGGRVDRAKDRVETVRGVEPHPEATGSDGPAVSGVMTRRARASITAEALEERTSEHRPRCTAVGRHGPAHVEADRQPSHRG